MSRVTGGVAAECILNPPQKQKLHLQKIEDFIWISKYYHLEDFQDKGIKLNSSQTK